MTSEKENRERKRACKACLSCRKRKAKCQFDSSHPPDVCIRCYREGKECVFVASRRGGRANIEKGLRAKMLQQAESGYLALPGKEEDRDEDNDSDIAENDKSSSDNDKPLDVEGGIDPESIAFSTLRNPSDSLDLLARTAFVPENQHSSLMRSLELSEEPKEDRLGQRHLQPNGSEKDEEDLYNTPKFHTRAKGTPEYSGPDIPPMAPPTLPVGDRGSISKGDTERRGSVLTRRITVPPGPIAPTPGLTPGMSRSPDSINLTPESQGSVHPSPNELYKYEADMRIPCGAGRPQEKISEFCLVRTGVLNPTQLRTLVATFFSRHHHYLPLIPAHLIPTTDESLEKFAAKEPVLLVAFVIIASRFENNRIHDASWAFMRGIINDLVMGVVEPSVGDVEAMLLLSENIPRHPEVTDANLHKLEARISWNMIGLAIRTGYFLGFDQKTLIAADESMDEETHRMRLVWTYCYTHDRQASVRLGKAFWSRGPSLCFENPCVTSSIGTEAFTNFPTLIPSAKSPEDYASLMQAHVELTQILTNIHDTLYPNRDRTIALVRVGEYYKILDEFTRTFSAYRFAWKGKQWKMFPLNETVWVTFHYAKLYAYAFAFQAHVRRNAAAVRRGKGGKGRAQLIFPRGLTGCVDAKFIVESKKAASDLLEICINQLYRGGALAYLPVRYYGYLSYAAVFLVKVAFTGAVMPKEQKDILNLIKRVIAVSTDETMNTDRQHPLVRCANQLRTLVKTIWTAEGVMFSSSSSESNGSVNGGAGVLETQRQGLSEDSDESEMRLEQEEVGVNDLQPFMDTGPSSTEFSGSFMDEGSDAALEDLTAMLAIDLDSDVWLSYFVQSSTEPYTLAVAQ